MCGTCGSTPMCDWVIIQKYLPTVVLWLKEKKNTCNQMQSSNIVYIQQKHNRNIQTKVCEMCRCLLEVWWGRQHSVAQRNNSVSGSLALPFMIVQSVFGIWRDPFQSLFYTELRLIFNQPLLIEGEPAPTCVRGSSAPLQMQCSSCVRGNRFNSVYIRPYRVSFQDELMSRIKQ